MIAFQTGVLLSDVVLVSGPTSEGTGRPSVPRWQSESCSVMSNSLQPHELQPTRLFCPQNSPDRNIGVGSLSLLQGIFPNPEIEPRSHALQANS